jgi:dipeptidyl aminopeptidase/acylaminoacyl peptidase
VALLADGNVNRPSAWSSDGRYLLVRREAPTGGDLLAIDLKENNQVTPVAASPFDETRGQFSPDVRWVSLETTESGRSEVYVQPFRRAGARVQISAGGGTQARWNPNGREIFYISPDARVMAVDLRATGDTLEAGAPRALFPVRIFRGGTPQANYRINYAVAPDGQRFLVALTPSDSQVDTPITLVLNWSPPD